jgi:hypothetical protein
VSDVDTYKPLRDAKGRLLPGQRALNRTGLEPRLARMVRDLGALTPKAIKTLERLMDDPNPSAALGAAKEVLDRNLGKVRQTLSVDVTSTSVLHLEALQLLSERKRQQQSQVIDNTANTVSHSSNATLDRIGLHGDSTLALSADDYSVSMGDAEPPRPPDDRGAAAYAPPTPDTHQNPTAPQDDTP